MFSLASGNGESREPQQQIARLRLRLQQAQNLLLELLPRLPHLVLPLSLEMPLTLAQPVVLHL